MYSNIWLAKERQRTMLTRAAERRRVYCLRTLRRASRRAERAEELLYRARYDALRVSRELNGS